MAAVNPVPRYSLLVTAKNGRVTLAELRAFIETGVTDHVRKKLKKHQTPQFAGPQPEGFAFPVGRAR